MSTKEEVKAEFEIWLETQDESVKTLINNRFSALETTVKAVREERDNFGRELKSLARNVDKESDAGKQLDELRNKLKLSERKSTFLEAASKQGITKPSVVYAYATNENMFTEDGEPDWARMKETVPELFKVSDVKTHAGTNTNPKTVESLEQASNNAFRAAAKGNK